MTRLPELLTDLDRLGVKLSARGDRVHYRAPAGSMTSEIKAALAAHKPALLRLLADRPAAPAPPPAWPPRPAELAEWPVEWRARWGCRANELQDQGVPWPDHERLAFAEVKAAMLGGSI